MTTRFIDTQPGLNVRTAGTAHAPPVRRPSSVPEGLYALDERERRKILIDWNDTHLDYPKDTCIHQLFEQQAVKTPDAPAVAFGEEQLTYRQLNERANRLANHLRGLGVRAETLVGLCVDRSLEMLVGMLGVLKAGGAYVPLDPNYPAQRIAFMLEDTQAPVLLTQAGRKGNLPSIAGQNVLCLDSDWDRIAASSDQNPSSDARAESLAYVIYTSGSTGKPKGVCLEHRNTVSFLCWAMQVFKPADLDGVLAGTSICFDLSIFELFLPLSGGGKVIIAENALALPSIPRANEVVLINTVPSAIAELVRSRSIPASVRIVNLAGEPLSQELVELIYRNSQVQKVYDLYGPTECTTYSTYTLRTRGGIQTIGRPIANTRVYVLDDHREPVPVGEDGELWIGGDGVARGYLKRPDLTEQKFIPDPFSEAPGATLYRTGDLARYLPDGNIKFLGRIDHQVKIRGFRVELGEIESALAQASGAKQVVVLAREDVPGDKRLVAYLVAAPGAHMPAWNDLRSALKEKLPEYMVPSAMVVLAQMPLSPNGKIDRKALPPPAQGPQRPVADRTAASNPLASALLGTWQQILGRADIGAHDNFFDLGGDSLLAARTIARIRSNLAIDVSLKMLFEHPTAAALADAISASDMPAIVREQPIRRISRDGLLPLSFGQESLWFLSQSDDRGIYNMAYALRLDGRLNVPALEQSLRQLLQRHEMLRARYVVVDGVPCQMISSDRHFELPLIDVSDEPADTRLVRAQDMANEDARRPFDLAAGLSRFTLLRLSSEDHVLVLCMHHSISDGWSMSILLDELGRIYSASCEGKSPDAPEPNIDFVDFANWQQQHLTDIALSGELAYWKKQLAAVPELLELPTDRPRPRAPTYAGGRLDLCIPESIVRQLRELCRREGVTLYMALLAAWKLLLSRYSGHTDIVVGSPAAGRNRRELEDIVGFLTNMLPIRTDLSGDPTVSELLQRVKTSTMGALAHQDVPTSKLTGLLQPHRTAAHSEIFQVLFVLQNTPKVEHAMAGLRTTIRDLHNGTAKTDLSLSIDEGETGLSGWLEYSTDLFDATTAQRILEHYQTLLAEIASKPAQRASRVSILSAAERRFLVSECNASSRPYRSDASIHQVFQEHATRTPEAQAVICGDEELSYDALNRKANRLAHYLRELGVGAETPIAVCMERSIDVASTLLGILKAGGTYVPLNPNDPPQRLALMLDDCKAPVLLTQAKLKDKLPSEKVRIICIDDNAAEIARRSDEDLNVNVAPDCLAQIMYTSGSTGLPKGVQITHRGVLALVSGDCVRFDSTRRFLQLAPVSFDGSSFEIWGPLLNGGCCCVFPGRVPLPAELGRMLREKRITTVLLTPSLFNTTIDEAPEALASVDELLVGGEALSPSHIRRGLKLLPNTTIINAYGPTEGTVIASCYRIPRDFDANAISIPIGRPIANAQVYIVDEHMQPQPIGVAGELCIGGAGVARGYLNRPELTAGKFVADPFSTQPGARLYRTGDLARLLPDGNIEFLGRIDNQVKIRAFRIELGEIETVLCRQPGVREAVVMAREDAPGERRLVAYLVPAHPGEHPRIDGIRNALKQQLPDYMVPAAFVILDMLPLNSNGKVDRKALPQPESTTAEGGAYVAPRTPTEVVLSEIWRQLLHLKEIGIDSSFFDVGGHSLLAVRLLTEIETAFGLRLPLTTLMQAQTIRSQAELIRRHRASTGRASIVKFREHGAGRPLFLMPSMYGETAHWQKLFQYLHPVRPVYGIHIPIDPEEIDRIEPLEELASVCRNALRKAQPRGPYHLVGYSFGGMLAYEVARQFAAEGETVGLVGVIDTGPGGTSVLDVPNMLRNLPYCCSNGHARWAIRQVVSWLKFQHSRFTGHRSVNPELAMSGDSSSLPDDSPLMEYYGNLAKSLYASFERYSPAPYPGRITLFRARVDSPLCPYALDRGWRAVAAGGVDVRVVSGNHLSMIEEPHVGDLARAIDAALNATE